MTDGHTPDLIERLRKQAEGTSEISRQMAEDKSLRQDDNHERRTDLYMWLKPEQTLEGRAADEITALRDRVAALEGVLEDGIDHVNWINAQAENAMATVATVTASREEGNVSLWMIDSIASDIGINAMMFTDKARSILSRAQQGGGDGRG